MYEALLAIYNKSIQATSSKIGTCSNVNASSNPDIVMSLTWKRVVDAGIPSLISSIRKSIEEVERRVQVITFFL